jgi:hypothetical protein
LSKVSRSANDEDNKQVLAGQILELDEAFISIGVIGLKSGQTLSRAMKNSFIEKYARDEGAIQRAGMWATTATSILLQLDNLFSETQSIVILRKDIKQLIIPIPSREIIITATIDSRSDGRGASVKIRSFLDIFSE